MPARYWPGARVGGTWTVKGTSRCSEGANVSCGVVTTIQREVSAFALPGCASCKPVVGAVEASTGSTFTVTGWSFGLLTRRCCVSVSPGVPAIR